MTTERVKAYKISHQGDRMKELGSIGVSDTIRYVQSLTSNEGEILPEDKEYTLGLSRTEEDFIEITYVGKDQFLVFSNVLFPPESFWQRFFANADIEVIVTGVGAATLIATDYIAKTREDFERSLKSKTDE